MNEEVGNIEIELSFNHSDFIAVDYIVIDKACLPRIKNLLDKMLGLNGDISEIKLSASVFHPFIKSNDLNGFDFSGISCDFNTTAFVFEDINGLEASYGISNDIILGAS